MKKLRLFFQSEIAFTLIELLLVIIFLGILSAIALPRLFGFKEKADSVEAVVALGSIKTALEVYNYDNNAYPNNQTVFDNMASIIEDYNSGKWYNWTVVYNDDSGGSDFSVVMRLYDVPHDNSTNLLSKVTLKHSPANGYEVIY